MAQSAARVRTIAALHDRLYRADSTLDVEIGPYLGSLVDNLRAPVGSPLEGRGIAVEADTSRWAAADVPALGLVLIEPVTNALKYGAGDIRATFRMLQTVRRN